MSQLGSASRKASSVLLVKLGNWRSQLLFRGYGLCLFFVFLLQYHWPVRDRQHSLSFSYELMSHHITSRPFEEHLMTLAGVGLIILGARTLTVTFACVAMCLFLRINMADPQLFPAVEYVLFTLVPTLGCAAIAGEWIRSRLTNSACDLNSNHVDRSIVWIFRLAMLTTMFFVTVHKLNTDFMNPETSCENIISGWLEEAWYGIGPLIGRFGGPFLTVLIEGTILIVLLLTPLVGIIYTSIFFIMLGLVGAPSTAAITMVMSWSFFPEETLRELRSIRNELWALILLVTTCAVLLSFNLYRGIALSRELMILVELLAIAPGLTAAALLWQRWRGNSEKPWQHISTRDRVQDFVPGAGLTTIILATLALCVFMWNGISPYLGTRFNYSFAMWSNLRTDNHRWNSWVIPQSLGRPDRVEDHFVEVKSVEFLPTRGPLMPSGKISPEQFIASVRRFLFAPGVSFEIALFFDGHTHTFQGPGGNEALRSFVRNLEAKDEGSHVDRTLTIERAFATLNVMKAMQDFPDDSPYERKLEPALFSTTAFREMMEESRQFVQNLNLSFSFRGKDYEIKSTLKDDEFFEFVGNLDRNNLFTGKLALAGKQRCFH